MVSSLLLSSPVAFNYDEVVPHLFVVKIKDGRRDSLRSLLATNNIESGIHYLPNHLLTKYRTPYTLPSAEKLYDEMISLPMHLDLDDSQLQSIISVVKGHAHG